MLETSRCGAQPEGSAQAQLRGKRRAPSKARPQGCLYPRFLRLLRGGGLKLVGQPEKQLYELTQSSGAPDRCGREPRAQATRAVAPRAQPRLVATCASASGAAIRRLDGLYGAESPAGFHADDELAASELPTIAQSWRGRRARAEAESVRLQTWRGHSSPRCGPREARSVSTGMAQDLSRSQHRCSDEAGAAAQLTRLHS